MLLHQCLDIKKDTSLKIQTSLLRNFFNLNVRTQGRFEHKLVSAMHFFQSNTVMYKVLKVMLTLCLNVIIWMDLMLCLIPSSNFNENSCFMFTKREKV